MRFFATGAWRRIAKGIDAAMQHHVCTSRMARSGGVGGVTGRVR